MERLKVLLGKELGVLVLAEEASVSTQPGDLQSSKLVSALAY